MRYETPCSDAARKANKKCARTLCLSTNLKVHIFFYFSMNFANHGRQHEYELSAREEAS